MDKKYSNMDDLFRDKFKDFELYPPDHIWENIKQKIQTADTGKSGKNISNGGIIGITILLILTSVTMIYFLQYRSDKSINKEFESLNPPPGSTYKSVPRSVDFMDIQTNEPGSVTKTTELNTNKLSGKEKPKTRFDLTSDVTAKQGKTELTVNSTKPVNKSLIQESENKISTNPDKGAETLLVAGFNITPGDDSELLAYNNTEESVTKKSEKYGVESGKLIDENRSMPETSPSPEPNPDIRSDYGRKGNWLFGIFFTPEMIYYPSASELNNRNYSLDLNAIYSFSGYQIQSGIGFGWSSDNGNYQIDYNRYLGSYDDVFDVTFDTINGQLIPVYHTEVVQVYDSIDHVTITPTKRKFTYLNIPVLFGYGNEGRRFGWSVKAGPSVSFLIHENIPDINLTDSQNKILNVDGELPGRLKTNWQFVFVGGASYKLSNSLNVTLEPVFRYYLNSAYEQNSLTKKSPYSIGLRAGFVLGF
jgi:hypothetical protein